MSKRKPPEYKCIKMKLIKILNTTNTYKDQNVLETINNTVIKTNKIVIKAYMLLRLWILKKYEEDTNNIPILNSNMIRLAFISVTKKGKENGQVVII